LIDDAESILVRGLKRLREKTVAPATEPR